MTTQRQQVGQPLILHVLPETADAGAEKQARYLIAELRESERWSVELAYFRAGRAHQAFASIGVPMHEVPARRRLAVDVGARASRLRRLYRRRKPAIVHAWMDEANLVAAVAAGVRRPPALIISQRCGGLRYEESAGWPWALKAIRRRADHAIANSADGLRYLRTLGYDAAVLSLISNGIPPAERDDWPLQRKRARAELGLDDGDIVVGFVGRPDRLKDLPNLFAAMNVVRAALPGARLALIGPTSSDIVTLGLSAPACAIVVGWNPDPQRLMPAFDVMALSSLTEGHSNSVDEALISGLPVATTDVGDHPELVAEAGGKVVPVRRPDLLGQAILDLIRDPPSRSAVQETASTRLSMQSVLRATEQIYRSLLAPDRRSDADRHSRHSTAVSQVVD
ncbi:MAG TPA: glycosyltransferase [Solirubrobacteraceae bacterium]|nr:glycosyltransferase [Solirubrobacteraceae bacterium]